MISFLIRIFSLVKNARDGESLTISGREILELCVSQKHGAGQKPDYLCIQSKNKWRQTTCVFRTLGSMLGNMQNVCNGKVATFAFSLIVTDIMLD